MKIRLYILASLGILAACAHEPMESLSESAPDSFELRATIAPDGPATRTILVDNPGVRVQTCWKAGDAIGIFPSGGDYMSMSVSAGDIADNGKTAVFRSSTAIPSGSISAYYPARSGASSSGGKISTVFPSTQTYVKVQGVPQPDPEVSLMAGVGTAMTGVAFCNVMAVLKIGQSFDEITKIKSVTFRDISGTAVSGDIIIDLNNNYSSSVSGGSDILTLDCGEEGVTLEKDALGVFYFIIPARNYPQGIEITFITDSGERMSCTVGTTKGATFNRGVIYPIGEVSNHEYLGGKDASVLSDNAYMMTPELLRQMTVIERGEALVRNFDGGTVVCDGVAMKAPWYKMMVSNDLGFKKGDYFVFDESDELPTGGVYKVVEAQTPFGDKNHSCIELRMTADFAGAFKKLEFGEELYDKEGNSIEGAGETLDMASYVSEVVDSEGNSVPFSVSSDGQIMLTDEVVEDLLTKAIIKHETSLSTPTLSREYKTEHCEASVGVNISIDIRAGLKIADGELQWLHVMFNPKVNFSAEFTLSGSDYQSKSYHLITLYCLPGIPISPGVFLTPELELRATVGIGGEVKFSTSIKYSYDLGKFGFSYLNGQGFTFHSEESKPAPTDGFKPDVDFSLTGTIYARAGLMPIPSISICKVLRAGMYIDCGLKFGLTGGAETIEGHVYEVRRLFLQPDIKFSPYVASLGGVFTKKWDDLIPSPEFDPIWERYLQPVIKYPSTLNVGGIGVAMDSYKYTDGTNYYILQCQEQMSDQDPLPIHFIGVAGHPIYQTINKIDYGFASIKPTLDEWDVVIDVDSGTLTNLPWGQLVLMSMNNITTSYLYLYTDRYNLDRYTIMTIPAGKDDPVGGAGNVELEHIYSGAVRSVHLRCINKRNKAVYEAKSKGPFAFYWPDTPDGPWFKWISVSEYEYNQCVWPVWPSDVPLP